ncbi:lipid II flippase MurJ, partial [Verminephrobacter eiseniae]
GAGLPLTLPFVARTLASGAGEGALATFNYAWKLVELPLVLAIQLVAALAFPAIAQAHADGKDAHALARAVRSALVMAWTLACASAAALLAGAPVIARLLFGWGRMQAPALEQIAAWGSAGAWGLLPQALLAVALTVLATWGRMRFAVLAYALALALLLLAGVLGLTAGQQLMWALNAGFMVAALVAWSALGAVRHWVPLRTLLAPFAALLVVAWLVQWLGPADGIAPIVPIGHGRLRELVPQLLPQLLLCALAALAVIASGWFSGPHLRNALRS